MNAIPLAEPAALATPRGGVKQAGRAMRAMRAMGAMGVDRADRVERAARRRRFFAGCLAGAAAMALIMVALPGGATRLPAREESTAETSAPLARSSDRLVARTGAAVPAGLRREADPGRLVGPLALLLDPATAGSDPYGHQGTIRHRYRQLSYHVLTPLAGLSSGVLNAGEVVIVEDGDDDVATAIVYRFASDGTVVASAPSGDLLGTLDPTTPAFLDQLRAASGQRIIVSSGRE